MQIENQVIAPALISFTKPELVPQGTHYMFTLGQIKLQVHNVTIDITESVLQDQQMTDWLIEFWKGQSAQK